MMPFAIIVFVQAERTVAVEVFEITVERQRCTEQCQLIRGTAAKRWRSGKRGNGETDFHRQTPNNADASPAIMKDRRQEGEGRRAYFSVA